MRLRLSVSQNKLLYFLILYMPFHYYLCELLIKETSLDNIIRDIIVIFLFVNAMKKKFTINKSEKIVAINCVVILIFALLSYVMNHYDRTFNILRTYLVPMLIYFVVNRINLNEKQFVSIHHSLAILIAIVGIYGFFQAFFLGDDFLIKLGYESNGMYLSGTSYYIGGFFGFQRNVGTFISPNIAGVIFAIAICILLYFDFKMKRKLLYMGMLGIGLITTFSRSAISGLLLTWVFMGVLLGRFKKIKTMMVIRIIVFDVVIIVGVLLVDKYFLNNLLISMISSSFSGMVHMSDLSTIKHAEDLILPLRTVLKNLLGRGFGNNGPMALRTTSTAISVESSIYLIMYEIGPIFGILFFVPYITVIINTIRHRKFKYYVPAAMSIATMFTYILLPNVQTYEILFYSYVFIGLYYNKSVWQIYHSKESNTK